MSAEQLPGDYEGGPLTAGEFANLTKFAVEAAVPAAERTYCPQCSIMVVARTDDDTMVRCPDAACGVTFCCRCDAHPYHHGCECPDRGGEAAQASGADRRAARRAENATARIINATTKPCPNCGTATSHYHGHACHHISPSTDGCANCHMHWCFRCSATAEENLRDRGARERCKCNDGNGGQSWSSFCADQLPKRYRVDTAGFVSDRRCGCVLCPDCREGQGCSHCDGTCVVCRGHHRPASMELADGSADPDDEADAELLPPPPPPTIDDIDAAARANDHERTALLLVRAVSRGADALTVSVALGRVAEMAGQGARALGEASAGTVTGVVQALSRFAADANIARIGCAAVRYLTQANADNARRFGEAGGYEVVLATLRRHESDLTVAEHARAAVRFLTVQANAGNA